MSEHHHSPEHGHHEHHKKEPSEQYVLPASILVAAVLISGSLLYGVNSLKNSGVAPTGLGQALQQPGLGENQGAPATVVDIPEREGVAVLGSSDAKVTVVEYSDFQCPFCQRFFNDTYLEIKSKYVDSGKVKFEYRHFPLSSHQNAEQAAVASECALRQGKFFEYHDVLFENMEADGTGLEIADLKGYANSLGLNTSSFNQCLDNNETVEIVKGDLDAGINLGVSGTPTLFINGTRIVGAQPTAVFEAAIEAALEE